MSGARYALAAILAIVIFAVLLAAPLLERTPVFAAALILLVAAIVLSQTASASTRAEARKSAAILASLQGPRPRSRPLCSPIPAAGSYFQEVGHYELAHSTTIFIAPSDVRDRITLVYSAAREVRFDRHDTESLTAQNLSQFSALPIIPYDGLLTDPSPHLFALYSGGWDWTDQAFAEDRAVATPIAPWFDGQASFVSFPNRQ